MPAEYKTLYATLASNIGDLERQDEAGSIDPAAPSGGTLMTGELDVAAGNRGPELLTSATMDEVAQTLDHFQQLDMKGVVILIAYPMLLPDFPHAAAYLHFYEQVASLISARSMVLSVELNPAFSDPHISNLHPDYRGLSMTTYATGQRQEAQLVIDDLHPRYLTLVDEPSTFASTLGLPVASGPGVVSLLHQELAGLSRGTTQIGAGIGTWESPVIEQAIAAETNVDYLSVHVYPTGIPQIANLNQVTTIAATARKPLIMDETWLSKSNPSGSPAPGSAVTEQKIKNWSFWEPLDAEFVTAMVGYCRSHGISLVSPFSTDLFYGYLDWSPTLETATNAAVRAQARHVQLADIGTGQVDDVGRAYAAAARQR